MTKRCLSESIDRARRLRRESTSPERILWSILRGGQLAGLKFRRQHPIGPYIADFYCHSASLVVELDGMSHDTTREYDQRRDEYLKRQGLTVLRILNDEVMSDLDAVAMAILAAAGVELG
jgi:very-short-patch-repair endonuclease